LHARQSARRRKGKTETQNPKKKTKQLKHNDKKIKTNMKNYLKIQPKNATREKLPKKKKKKKKK